MEYHSCFQLAPNFDYFIIYYLAYIFGNSIHQKNFTIQLPMDHQIIDNVLRSNDYLLKHVSNFFHNARGDSPYIPFSSFNMYIVVVIIITHGVTVTSRLTVYRIRLFLAYSRTVANCFACVVIIKIGCGRYSLFFHGFITFSQMRTH